MMRIDYMAIFISFLGILITSVTIIIALGDRYVIKRMMDNKKVWKSFVFTLFSPIVCCFIGIIVQIIAMFFPVEFKIFQCLSLAILILLMFLVIWLLVELYLAVSKSNIDKDSTVDKGRAELRKRNRN